MIFDPIDCCIENFFKPRSQLFKKLLGNLVVDALFHMPSYTIEKIFSFPLSENDIGKIVSTKVLIECLDLPTSNSKRPIKIWSRCGNDDVELNFFNYKSIYAKRNFPVGKELNITGKLTKNLLGNFLFTNPSKVSIKKSGFFNVYPLSTGTSIEGVQSIIKSALNRLKLCEIEEWIPKEILKKNNWKSFYDSLFSIHNPSKNIIYQLQDPAFQRICFDELLAEQIAIRLSNQKFNSGNIIKNEKKLIKRLKDFLPFELTNSQQQVLKEIFKDMESGNSMTRLIQGDVGSGKTIVALIAALFAIESGYQCAILAPTEILARQHFEKISHYLCLLGIKSEILTANEKGKKRKEILFNVESGISKVLIGTHAIITEKVQFQNLALVIIDEQHRFGVNQRLQLIQKGKSPHILSMTATPIPRTIILSQFGDIEVSSITEKPKGRKEIKTSTIGISKTDEVTDSIKRILAKNQKVYWICPLIEESEKVDYSCVINRLKNLQKTFGQDVEMLHGKMKNEEKKKIFERFNSGDFKILVSTTVIEVGIDVPDATVIIIENAEKFGLAQLHQLRGRVGRSDLQSFCILLFDEKKLSKIATERLQIMRETNNGFLIAEKDLLLRGGGEILGTKQSGQKKYRTFDFFDRDNQTFLYQILKEASALASKIVNSNDLLRYQTLLKIFNKNNTSTLKKSF